jgi:chitinase
MNLYIHVGASLSKLLLDSTFYGRARQGVAANNDGLYNAFKKGTFDEGTSWQDIKALKAKGAARFWGAVAKAPWLHDGHLMMSYEDQESLKYKRGMLKASILAASWFGSIAMIWIAS